MVESTTPAFRHSAMIWSQRRRSSSRDFHDHMFAGPRARPAGSVASRWCADGHDIHGRIGQHVVEFVICPAAGRFGQFIGGGRKLIEQPPV